jgi:sRNA-binding carbon storage regulator CsrA
VEKPASGFFTELDYQVRLGITAPKDVVVDRAEVHQRKLTELTAESTARAVT